MNMDDFKKRVESTDWHRAKSYDEKYRIEFLEDALLRLANSDKEPISEGEIHRSRGVEGYMIDVIGNDHGGTYNPATLDALPFIIEVALEGHNQYAREHAINVLITLLHFSPEAIKRPFLELSSEAYQRMMDATLNREVFELDTESKALEQSVTSMIYKRKADFVQLGKRDLYNKQLILDLIDSINFNTGKSIYFQFENEEFWIEIGLDGYATRQIIKKGDLIKLSCRDDCLAEGIVDIAGIDADCEHLEGYAFEDIWCEFATQIRATWKEEIPNYPNGKTVSGVIKYFCLEGAVLELDNRMHACATIDKLPFEKLYPGNMMTGVVQGHADSNMWLILENSTINE